MRILINGYYYGGNCPPFVYQLKKFNKDTKLTNSLNFLDYHGINKDYISEDDIIDVKLSIFEKPIIYILKRIRINFWKLILIRRYRKLIEAYKPDIIINHKASEKAEIMLKTGFQPQLTYLYGGEVHGKRINDSALNFIFDKSTLVLTASIELYNYVLNNRPELKLKLKQYPVSPFELEKVNSYKRGVNKNDIKLKLSLPTNQKIFIDSRSLRGEKAGGIAIFNAVKNLTHEGHKFKMVFLRGHLGTDKMLQFLNEYINNNPEVKENILIIDKIVSTKEIWDLYYISDAFISLLPHDQFGSSIIDALFLECKLILSDLEAYKNELGDNALYVSNQDVTQLTSHMKKIIIGLNTPTKEDTLNKLVEKYSAESNYNDLYNFIKLSLTNNL